MYISTKSNNKKKLNLPASYHIKTRALGWVETFWWWSYYGLLESFVKKVSYGDGDDDDDAYNHDFLMNQTLQSISTFIVPLSPATKKPSI